MSKKLKIALISAGSLLLLCIVGVVISYRAAQYVPDFYADALAQDSSRRAEAGRELESRVTMLYSHARRKGDWNALFTAEQINAWLAHDLVELYGEQIPTEFRDPRVVIRPNGVSLGMRYEGDKIPVVFSLRIEPYLTRPNEIALRFHQARAGSLPFPLTSVLEQITEFARKTNLPLQWTQVEGDPVALIVIDPQRDADDNMLSLEALELHDGELYVSGRTIPASEDSAKPVQDADVAEGAAPKKNVQR